MTVHEDAADDARRAVDAVYRDFGTDAQQALGRLTVAEARDDLAVTLLDAQPPELEPPVAEPVITPITPDAGPVPMIGHVTSSYNSAALGRPFGLALVDNGRNRFGEIVKSPLGDGSVDVEITSPVLFDPEGSRRDG